MPPKKSTKAAKAPGAQPQGQDLTGEYTAELKSLATQAQHDSAASSSPSYVRVIFILTLLGVASDVSLMTLSPVYGGIPSAVHHARVLMVGCFLGWAGNLFFRNVLPKGLRTEHLLPVVMAYVPMAQFFLFPYSEKLGAVMGPIVTEAATLGPLAVLSAAVVADELEGVKFEKIPAFVADAAPGLGSWGVFKLMEMEMGRVLRKHVGEMFVFTRMGVQVVLTAFYSVAAPSKWLALAIPALLHTSVLNTHVMTPPATAALNNTLLAEKWSLMERKESVTGYMSVIESLERGFRVMRCDHSLLGGQWTILQGKRVQEPIYGVFAMLEAVRLVETGEKIEDAAAEALIIGLGIGTTPSAFVEHGIDTTVVEIDPVVHEFAVKYFDLKENNPPVIADAVKYTAGLVEEKKTYDYIVHDVFTGGAEPIDLFTLEFLQGLSDLLKPNGVIAINYAGDFSLSAPCIVVRTILTVFPTCRIFRESPPDPNLSPSDADFTNMVIFCTKSASPLNFRPAVMEDFLQSRARQMFLQPQHEIQQLDFLKDESGEDGGAILRKNETASMESWHVATARGHWAIMRTVLPGRIWELW